MPSQLTTLPETNMEKRKGPIKATVLLKGDYIGFHVNLGECSVYTRADSPQPNEPVDTEPA